ncbi:hypothetical protein QQG09_07935 [Melissococcus plutonius]|nr:hypothetical protein [Melissococcus plutonius]MCV2498960.1 hypothetical protein [Melissococcus plutonius]MCV2501721.1 hypothetical protein [Melissococcus plutonius]MCV2505408.1 hypothetical protein [Melissococcus plutonius]MCV2507765.1 hypothetical protein [Melissococcus plutonius]MCV2520149.1 hypothetical protein [Melissococcus plutonius]
MNIKLWKHFKKHFSIYIGIGIIVSLLNAINIFYFQKLLDTFNNGLDIKSILVYGFTVVLVPILAYLEQSPKIQLQNSIFFYLKEKALTKISKIYYPEYLKTGSGILLQKIEAGSNAGRDINLNFYGRLFRELLPETLFNLFFIGVINIKFIPIILFGYIFIFIVTKYLLNILKKIKEDSLIFE